jgi:hypothetical protein
LQQAGAGVPEVELDAHDAKINQDYYAEHDPERP